MTPMEKVAQAATTKAAQVTAFAFNRRDRAPVQKEPQTTNQKDSAALHKAVQERARKIQDIYTYPCC